MLLPVPVRTSYLPKEMVVVNFYFLSLVFYGQLSHKVWPGCFPFSCFGCHFNWPILVFNCIIRVVEAKLNRMEF